MLAFGMPGTRQDARDVRHRDRLGSRRSVLFIPAYRLVQDMLAQADLDLPRMLRKLWSNYPDLLASTWDLPKGESELLISDERRRVGITCNLVLRVGEGQPEPRHQDASLGAVLAEFEWKLH